MNLNPPGIHTPHCYPSRWTSQAHNVLQKTTQKTRKPQRAASRILSHLIIYQSVNSITTFYDLMIRKALTKSITDSL
jgi:hypothetical protein